MLYRLHFGNDSYPAGNRLYKCVGDAKVMAKLFGSPSQALCLDKFNTRTNMIKAFTAIVTAAGPGDQVVVSYSGHGTQVRDRNNDEPDGWDEALVSIELSTIIDDVIFTILQKLNPKAQGFLFSDSCFSGTIQRAAPGVSSKYLSRLRKEKIRYLPASVVKPFRGKVTNQGPQNPVPQWMVISGCADFEFSYEGPEGGIMTNGVKKNAKKGITVQALYDKLAATVEKSGYNQHPQLTCTKASSKWVVPFI